MKMLNFDLDDFPTSPWASDKKGEEGICSWVVFKQKISLLKHLHVNTETLTHTTIMPEESERSRHLLLF